MRQIVKSPLATREPSTQDIHFELALPVKYSKERPEIDILWKDRGDLLEKMLLTKADYWEYEHEWRMIAWNRGVGARKFPSLCLDAVIFGARISSSDRKIVLSWIRDRHDPVEIYSAEFDDKLFRLNLVAQ
jgi:hypothetical protein